MTLRSGKELVKNIEKPTSSSKPIVEEVVKKEPARENDKEKPIEEVNIDSPMIKRSQLKRVDLVKESIEGNALKETPLINHKASIVHPVNEEAKKAQGNTKVVKAPQYSS
ncbi:hypothetical protein PanWU01x14_292670 [Parasponia andersonii]|uniref:Uncharacterized protein n=1 Tax=Parasponia andersonii TaxID=3476 RepID=A0A2P5AX24_PARAD|nr:hypothetical protein PanWU01x14_292670 [Parasponia andersonii]